MSGFPCRQCDKVCKAAKGVVRSAVDREDYIMNKTMDLVKIINEVSKSGQISPCKKTDSMCFVLGDKLSCEVDDSGRTKTVVSGGKSKDKSISGGEDKGDEDASDIDDGAVTAAAHTSSRLSGFLVISGILPLLWKTTST